VTAIRQAIRDQAVALRRAGKSAREAAAIVGASAWSVSAWASAAGVAPKKYQRYSDEYRAAAVARYHAGESDRELSESLGVRRATVRDWLTAAGVKRIAHEREILLTYRGKTLTLGQWAAKRRVPKNTLRTRIEMHGLERAMLIPPAPRTNRQPYVTGDCTVDREITLSDVADELDVSRERCRQLEAVAMERVRIGVELVEVMGVDLAEELLREMRHLPISEWRVIHRKWKRIANERKKAA
jgi:transposase